MMDTGDRNSAGKTLPAIMISHSTSSCGPSGRNRFVSPIICKSEMLSAVREELSVELFLANTMNVNSESKLGVSMFVELGRSHNLPRATDCHRPCAIFLQAVTHFGSKGVNISFRCRHLTLHFILLLKSQRFRSCGFQQLGTLHPFMIPLPDGTQFGPNFKETSC